MADGITTNYGFTKPEKGASENSWGDKLNANWDKADLQIKANADAIGALDTSTTSALSGKQPTDATLTSIAALGTAAGKALYTTGVDTWAEMAVTAAGRALLDDADATAQRVTLGLGSAALMDDSADSDLANDSDAAARRDVVKSYVDAEIAALTPTQINLGGLSAGPTSSAHGLGARPQDVTWFIQCATADAGFSVGDRIYHPSWQSQADSRDALTVWANGSQVGFSFFGSLFVATKAGAFDAINPARWIVQVSVRA